MSRYPTERLPLPHGFKCHIEYAREIDRMTSESVNLLEEIENCRNSLLLMQSDFNQTEGKDSLILSSFDLKEKVFFFCICFC